MECVQGDSTAAGYGMHSGIHSLLMLACVCVVVDVVVVVFVVIVVVVLLVIIISFVSFGDSKNVQFQQVFLFILSSSFSLFVRSSHPPGRSVGSNGCAKMHEMRKSNIYHLCFV